MNTPKNRTISEGMELARGRWRNYIQPVTEGYKRANQGKSPDDVIISNTAILLENTRKMMSRLDESTKVANLGNFVDYGFGVISAIMPSLLANELVSVQALKARFGTVFHLTYKYGSNKGAIKKGDTMISPFSGAKADTSYSLDRVSSELLGNAAATSFIGTLSYTRVKPGSVEITGGAFTLVDDGAGLITTKSGTSNLTAGTVNYDTGAVELTFSSAPSADLVAAYEFQFGNQEVGYSNIPEVDIDLGETPISTVTRSLRARWMFDAAYELESVHGINAEEEISVAMASEIRHEIDGEILNDIWAQAAAGSATFTWSKTPGTGVSFMDHKDTFVDKVIEMSNAIFKDTLRAEGNFIVAGVNVCSLIESIDRKSVV